MIKKQIIIIMALSFLTSCATLYSGRDLEIIPPESLQPVPKTVTFRFVSLSRLDSDERYFVRRDSFHSKKAIQYIKKLNVFSTVEIELFPYEWVSLDKGDDLNKLLNDSISNSETDYFIDVRIFTPFHQHGGGLGMWGSLISALSLGIIPSWWSHEATFDVVIYNRKEKKISFKIEESYNAFHSTIFHLAPSSEKTLGNHLNKVEKNTIVNIIDAISKSVKDLN